MSNCTQKKWPVASFLCHTVRSYQKINGKKAKRERKIDKQSEKNNLRVGESNSVGWIACLYGRLGIYVISRTMWHKTTNKRGRLFFVRDLGYTVILWSSAVLRDACSVRCDLLQSHVEYKWEYAIWVWRQSSFWRYATTNMNCLFRFGWISVRILVIVCFQKNVTSSKLEI